LSIGTWGLSGDGYGDVDPLERDRVIDRALELGINLFETADVYGRGEMEKCLGARLGDAASTHVVTKVGTFRSDPPPESEPGEIEEAYKRFDAAYLRQAVERSRERLKREKIDVVLLHNPSATTMSRGEAALVMKELKQSGAIGAWGVSVGDAYAARAALGHGAEVIELAYNIFFSRELHELAGDLAKAKTAVLARSVLSYGLLVGMRGPTDWFSPGDHRAERWTRLEFETRLRQLDAVRSLVRGDVLTMRGAAVRFVLCNEVVSSAVLGPKNVVQLEQLVREAGSGPPYLSEEALTLLASDLSRVGVVT